MSLEVFWLFVATETVLCLTPGPAVLLVLSQALARGPAKSLFSSLGILAANAAYFVLSATGLGALLLASYDLFFAIKWIGAGYLVYLGIAAIVGRAPVVRAQAGGAPPASDLRLFLNGFALQASNPKSLLFFTAILPQFVDPRAPLGLQLSVLGVASLLVEFVVLSGYGLLAGRAAHVAREPRYATITNRVAGTLLIGAGVGLAALRRR